MAELRFAVDHYIRGGVSNYSFRKGLVHNHDLREPREMRDSYNSSIVSIFSNRSMEATNVVSYYTIFANHVD
jgi:hypothetical protein